MVRGRRRHPVLPAAVLLGGLVACGGVDRLPRPEAVRERVVLGYPSVLGYARFRPAAGRTAAALLRKAGFLGRATGDSVEALLALMEVLGREGGFVNLVFIDPLVFGGSLALHFMPEEPGSLAQALREDDRFSERPGSDPPIFTWRPSAPGTRERILGLLGALGVEVPFQPIGTARFVVEETSDGTLVMPSLDLEGNLRRFLRDTGKLDPWGDTGLVVDLEVKRFARAHAEEIRRMGRTFRDLVGRVARMVGDPEARKALERTAAFLNSAALEAIEAVEGIRYTSATPTGGGPELRVLAAEGGALAAFMASLREGPVPFPHHLRPGLSLQWNAAPRDTTRLAEGALRFFGRTAHLDPEAVARAAGILKEISAGAEGRYFAGVILDREAKGLLCMSRGTPAEGGGDRSVVGLLHGLLRPGRVVKPMEAGPGMEGYKLALPFPGKGGGLSRGVLGALVAGSREELRFFAWVPEGDRAGVRTRVETLLKGRTAPSRVPGPAPPGSASCYLYFAWPPSSSPAMPLGVANLFFRAIMGYGSVEENELVIRIATR